MIRRIVACASVVFALALTGCNVSDVGYVEIKTVPVSASQPVLYLDSVKLDPIHNGVAVLKQRTGTVRLQLDSGGTPGAVVCEAVVRKDRITSLTLSVLDRPPRCQCANNARTDPASNKTCVS